MNFNGKGAYIAQQKLSFDQILKNIEFFDEDVITKYAESHLSSDQLNSLLLAKNYK